MSSTEAFLESVQAALSAPMNWLALILFLVLMGGIFLLIRIGLKYYEEQAKHHQLINPTKGIPFKPLKNKMEMNIAQRKVILDLIQEFRNKELISEAIPLSVMERFSEYLFQNMDRLKISNSFSRRVSPIIFPLYSGDTVELEVLTDNRLLLLKRKVLVANPRAIVVQNSDDLTLHLEKGMPVFICYTVNNQFIAGESKIVNLLPNNRLVLAYPVNLKITNERRFSRIPLSHVSGHLAPIRLQQSKALSVDVRDISMEGARIRIHQPLKKKDFYHLSFEDQNGPTPYRFEQFECVISQSFFIEDQVFEYGLSFVYIDFSTRNYLEAYLKYLSEKIKS